MVKVNHLENIDLDIFCLVNIVEASLKKKDISVWELAKKYLWKDKKKDMSILQNTAFYSRKSMRIMRRLESMENSGYLKIEKINGKTKYIINGDKIINRYRLPDGNKMALSIKGSRGKWIIFEI